jgi:hypothetical protein
MLSLGKKTVVQEESRDFGFVRAVEYENAVGKVFIHCDIFDWTLDSAKECLRIWPGFLEGLRGKGYKEIYSCIPDNDQKLAKWQTRFGLNEMKRVAGAIIFRRSIENGH